MICPDPTLLAEGYRWSSYWHGFLRFWGDFFGQQNGVVMTALLIAAIAAFIIMSAKWRK